MDYSQFGIDPEIAQQFALPEDERRRLLIANALLGLGAGLGNSRSGKGWGMVNSAAGGLAAGALAGQQAVSQARSERFEGFKNAATAQGFVDKRRAAEQRAAFSKRVGEMLQSAPDKYAALMQLSEEAAANGDEPMAKQFMALAEKSRPKYSQSPQVGVDPQTRQPYNYVLDEQGNEKRLTAGVKPDLVETDLGDRKVFNDRYAIQPGQSFQKNVDPNTAYTGSITLRGQDRVDARAREANAIAAANTATGKVGDLRKEFNALPQVKAYGEVQPVLQSAREAVKTDTAAADLNLIYAAAKIMDPNSVVRESETTMVVGSGSPAQRFMGQFNYVAGGGRLTAGARKALMAEVESRGRGYEAGYQSARKAYEGIATKNNIPTDQVFIEPFAGSQPQASGPLTPQEQARLEYLRKRHPR